MGNFGKCDITTQGHALLSKLISRKAELILTRVQVGDGIYTGDKWDMAEMISPRHEGIITRVTPNERFSDTECLFTNEGVTEYCPMNEVGIYAADPDKGEILYFYAVAGDRADFLIPYNGKELLEDRITFSVYTANTDKIVVNMVAATHANEIEFDNTKSKLKATRVQSAIDEHISDPTAHSSPKNRAKETCLLFQKLTNVIISDTGQVHNADEVNAFKAELSRYSNRLRSGINYYTFNDYDDPVFKDIISSLQTYQRTGWAPSIKKTGDAVHDAFADRISRLQSGVLDIGFDYGGLTSGFDTFLSNIQAVINGKVDDSFFDFEIESDDPAQGQGGQVVQPVQLTDIYIGDTPPENKNLLWAKPVTK